MRDQIIALKDKTDRMIAIRIPITVLEMLGRSMIDQQIAAGVMIQAADDIQQRRFPTAARS